MPAEKVYTISDLFRAATYGDVDALTNTVNHGVPIVSESVGGSTVLHFAAFGGHTKMVSHLLSTYPKCKDRGHNFDMQGYNALHNCCAFSGSIGVFQELVRAGFDVNTKSEDGLNAIELAEKFDKDSLVQYIRSLESDNSNEETNLQHWVTEEEGVISKEHEDDSTLTFTDDAESDERKRYTNVDLLLSAESGDIVRLDIIVKSGIDVGTTTNGGSSVLHYAAGKGQTKMISHLIKSHPSCLESGQKTDPKGFTALHYAALLGEIEMFELLFHAGMEMDTKTADGRSVLDIAREAKQTNMVKYLEKIQAPFEFLSLEDSGLGSLPKGSSSGSMVTSDTDTTLQKDVTEDELEDSLEVMDDLQEQSRDDIPPVTPEDRFSNWIGLHRSAASGNSLDVISRIENGADPMRKINSVFFPTIRLVQKEMLTPMEVAFYSRQNEMVCLLIRYTEEEIARKCLSKCEGVCAEMKPHIIKGLLKKKYKGKFIDIVFGKLLPKKLDMFVIYTKTIIHGTETMEWGYRVVFRDPTVSSEEGRHALRHSHENNFVLSEDDRKLVSRAIKLHSDKLWNRHSNLRGIMSSPVKSVRGVCKQKTCLVILCHFKGFVPDQEDIFPTELQIGDATLPVDVREGHVAVHHVMCPDALHTPLCFGCNIGTADDYTTRFGTIGPFVQLNDGKIGFLTCAHVVHGHTTFVDNSPPDITVLQPSNGDTSIPEDDRICGKVVHLKYSLNEVTSIDVAVVEITKPDRIPSSPGFSALNKDQLSGRGIPENGPLFDHGECGEPTIGEEVIKFGSASGLTYGTYRGIRDSEFSSKLYGRPSETERWKGVYYIENRQCKEKDCQPPPFSTPGDSGAGVFQVRDNNSLVCVGILVGVDTATGSGIVIPIKPILEEFGLTLKVFNTPDEQNNFQ